MIREKELAHHGKQANQKLKPYLVLRYLQKETDEEHLVTAFDIVEYLEQDCGITAERRSIYRDIDEINKAILAVEEGCTIEEAEIRLREEDGEDLRAVCYDKSRKGFYVRQRRFDLTDIRLLAECVYSTRFIAEGQAKRLLDVVCEFGSKHQAEKIKHNAFLTDRIKTNNRSVLNNIAVINEAMSRRVEGQVHKPEKIAFKYLRSTIDDMSKQVERRHGEKYIVSPYQLLINEGNYYLLAYDDRQKAMRTYRIDRMKEVVGIGEEREGEAEYRQMDLRTYTQRVFSMFGGEKEEVKIRFINSLLDTVIDRFGTQNARYEKVDASHFVVSTTVEISNQFFGWLCGFGKKARIMEPESVREGMKKFIQKIAENYQD